ncbi:MAG TPA: trypsin-like peptidase domain-containing protein [Gammaproteobacteria bacterium]
MKTLSFVLKASILGVIAALAIVLLTTLKNGKTPPDPSATTPESSVPSGSLHAAGPFSYAEAVARAAPSVVNIYTRKTVQIQDNNPASSILEHFFGIPRQPRSRVQSGLGSGVIFSELGHIVTNYHVVKDAEDIHISLTDGRDFPAQFLGADTETDLAILKIAAEHLEHIALGKSDNLRVGDVVLAIGNPFGVGQTVTMGIVSATGRDHLGLNTFENFIQTDAAINPGNSGGALINPRGELVGINTAIFSKTGSSLGIGFAIPVDMVKNVLSQMIRYGKVIRGWLGVEGRDLSPRQQQYLGTRGVLIAGIYRNGPADKAGLQYGDVIIEINRQPIPDTRSLLDVISGNRPGTQLNIRIWRNKEYKEVVAILAQRPQTQTQ